MPRVFPAEVLKEEKGVGEMPEKSGKNLLDKSKKKGSANLILAALVFFIMALVLYTLLFGWKYNWIFLALAMVFVSGLLIYGLYSAWQTRLRPGEDISCPSCGHKYRLPTAITKYDCPLCRKKIVVVASNKSGKKKAFVAPE